MIELEMVRQMVRRGVFLSPVAIGALWLVGGPNAAAATAIGVALALANLWMSGRVLGGLAENRPDLLLAGAFVSFGVGLAAITASSILLKRVDGLPFTVFAVSLVTAHLGLVTWEAADAFLRFDPPDKQAPVSDMRARS